MDINIQDKKLTASPSEYFLTKMDNESYKLHSLHPGKIHDKLHSGKELLK
jgi:hypothetical protein